MSDTRIIPIDIPREEVERKIRESKTRQIEEKRKRLWDEIK